MTNRTPSPNGMLIACAMIAVIVLIAILSTRFKQAFIKSERKHHHVASMDDGGDGQVHALPDRPIADEVVATPAKIVVGRICTARGTPIGVTSPSEIGIGIY